MLRGSKECTEIIDSRHQTHWVKPRQQRQEADAMQCVRQLRGALGGQVHLLGATAVCATTVEAGLHGEQGMFNSIATCTCTLTFGL